MMVFLIQLLLWGSLKVKGNFFVLTDLHYDIAYEPNYSSKSYCHSIALSEGPAILEKSIDKAISGRYYCDSPIDLINKVAWKMKEIDSIPDFILILGDHLAHHTMELFAESGNLNLEETKELVKKTYVDIDSVFKTVFPESQVIYLIGNNDGYVDYESFIDGQGEEYLEFLYNNWKELTGEIDTSFYEGGYYSVFTDNRLKIICLNSNYFSYKFEGSKQESNNQMAWFKQELNDSEENVIIAMHIPPGISIYNKAQQLWTDEYLEKFTELVQVHKEKILFIFAGHLHFSSFELLPDVDIPIIIHKSVSPIYGNNPGFRYYTYRDNFSDYIDYSLELKNFKWDSYRFSQLFEIDSLNMKSLYKSLVNDYGKLKNYISKAVGFDLADIEKSWKILLDMDYTSDKELGIATFLCSLLEISYDKFQICMEKMNSNMINNLD
ncbi:unnamed protein product [Blepharisma stoltei]|uniref:Calcineurin-like phosphoesterase domain-containing protein n=1 Tax=Blepharisma stoltei TaxID=1481888 RepID=A0AAU9JC26_9CILI|nr:unnamed protein product [Blepharisma stoltei]